MHPNKTLFRMFSTVNDNSITLKLMHFQTEDVEEDDKYHGYSQLISLLLNVTNLIPKINDDVQMEGSKSEPNTVLFTTVDKTRQEENSTLVGMSVCNCHKNMDDLKSYECHHTPSSTANMRGDGNCPFRTFSYIIVGVQNFHVLFMYRNIYYNTGHTSRQYLCG